LISSHFPFRISSFMFILLSAEVVAYCHPTHSLFLYSDVR
jgi:hypothetical protein